MSMPIGNVALLGLGASTQAAAEYLAAQPTARVSSITVYVPELPESAKLRAQALEGLGVRVVEGTQELDGVYDLGVVSPGIPATGPFYKNGLNHCIELISEPELAWLESPADWVCITGTNGKTTTTTLTCELIKAGGRDARTVGNIGLPPIACVADRKEGEVFVAEMSSFQLESSYAFTPHVGVLLNVTPDHVEWHGSLEAYAAAKERAFNNMGADDLALLGDDETCHGVAARLRQRGIRTAVIGEAPEAQTSDACWIDSDGRLNVMLRGETFGLCLESEMHIKGPHNMQNALAAAAAALEMGADVVALTQALAEFAPLAHRIEPCGTVEGVSFFDDSKGTNVDAVVKAIGAFEAGKVVLLAGGHDKGTELDAMTEAAMARCKAVVAFGEAGERFFDAFEAAKVRSGASCQVVRASHMREAFDAARQIAVSGDVVLLSPACSSFDEFTSYAERGNTFQKWVADLVGEDGESAER